MDLEATSSNSLTITSEPSPIESEPASPAPSFADDNAFAKKLEATLPKELAPLESALPDLEELPLLGLSPPLALPPEFPLAFSKGSLNLEPVLPKILFIPVLSSTAAFPPPFLEYNLLWETVLP